MDYWNVAELEAIAANPKRKHVLMLLEEVRRLTAIGYAAEQLMCGVYVGTTEDILRAALLEKLGAPRTPVRD